jgi:hypothetical protein
MKLNRLDETSDRYDGFKDYEIQRLERDLDWMKKGKKLTKSIYMTHVQIFIVSSTNMINVVD